MRDPRSPVGRRGGALLCAVLALSMMGCYRVRFHHSKLIAEAGAPREKWHHGLANGVWDLSGPLQLDEMCPTGEAVVENEVTFVDGLVQELSSLVFVAPPLALTGSPVYSGGFQLLVGRHLNAWTPSTVRVWCARGAVSSQKYAVLQLTPLEGVDQRFADLITAGLVSELRRRPGVSVLAQADIAALIGIERQKAVLGCSEGTSCIAELADALGASRVVHGTVGRVGGSLAIFLTSVDAAHARTVAQVSARLKSDDALFEALPGLANQLLAEPLAPAK